MSFSFNTALSGLNAQANALNVVGNNIANANTIGFRSSSITFSDVFANSYGARLNGAGSSMQIGNGVRTGAIHTSFAAGNINESGSPLHAAIQGNGFFVVRNADGTSGFTRAGDFIVDNKGFLRSTNGGQVQGYMAQNGVIPQGASLAALKLPLGQQIAPQVTTNATMRMNLNTAALPGTEFNATMVVHDSRGTERSLDMTFTKLADGSFDMVGTLDGTPFQTSVNGNPADANPVNFTFDANGALLTPTSLSIVPDQTALNGATLPSIDINLYEINPDGSQGASNITSYDADSAVSTTIADGYSTGSLNGASVDASGTIFGLFSNGQTRVIGQYAVATFNAEGSLQRQGGNMFAETIASGQPTIGQPGTGGRGQIAGGYLEQSNVNITNEFVDLIEAQRGFQSNSRVITTLNQTFQDLLQIL
ncbi:MAG: flagellar hook protein FlgE [Pyrinomonadaceae bacterium]|nr:flagellar hook protein FlgE [Pyrinomonadaceae bacterium]